MMFIILHISGLHIINKMCDMLTVQKSVTDSIFFVLD